MLDFPFKKYQLIISYPFAMSYFIHEISHQSKASMCVPPVWSGSGSLPVAGLLPAGEESEEAGGAEGRRNGWLWCSKQ